MELLCFGTSSAKAGVTPDFAQDWFVLCHHRSLCFAWHQQGMLGTSHSREAPVQTHPVQALSLNIINIWPGTDLKTTPAIIIHMNEWKTTLSAFERQTEQITWHYDWTGYVPPAEIQYKHSDVSQFVFDQSMTVFICGRETMFTSTLCHFQILLADSLMDCNIYFWFHLIIYFVNFK